jgi:methionine-rich copper-binding protein CopC
MATMNTRTATLVLLAVALLGGVGTANAQTSLTAASPPPESVLNSPPDTVTLTFDRLISSDGLLVKVSNEAGERVDLLDAHVNPNNAFTVSASLPPLPEGRYQVTYTVLSPGSSTVLSSGYVFSIDLPDPVLQMLSPVNGQAFGEPNILLRMQVTNFDFSLYDNRIHLYVDSVLTARLETLEYAIEDLAPGVHQIKAVLARSDTEELADTANVAYIAVARPDPETSGRELAAVAPPDAGLRMTALQWILVVIVILALLASGIWMGRSL